MKKEDKFTLWFSPFTMFVLILFSKLFGEANRRAIGPIESLSWTEVWEHIPKYLLITGILTILARIIFIEGVKQQEKNLEEARKRLKEKEKKEKDQNDGAGSKE
jgi:hypothetical protein